jgi:serine/threonine protein kinase
MAQTLDEFTAQLVRSKLMKVQTVHALRQRWQNDAESTRRSARGFSRWLVAKGYLTSYQVGLIERGYTTGFFLNDYKILDRLGQGRMAGVYRAVHRLGQTVAIKVLPPSKVSDRQVFGRFQREARLAVRLKHPNVVRTFHKSETEGLHYIVMEHLEGETLDEVLQRRGRLSVTEAVRLIFQALQGLQHLHDHGVVHRDLKPANLMLVPRREPDQPDTTLSATVKLLDVGLGRALFDEPVPASPTGTDDFETPATLTNRGELLGEVAYMAPEQAKDAHRADIRSDIYTLGLVLYAALAGEMPFADKPVYYHAMLRQEGEQPRPLRERIDAVPPELEQVVSRMMAQDPAQRPPTPEQAAQALQRFLTTAKTPPQRPASPPGMQAYLQWLDTQAPGEDAGPSAVDSGPDDDEPEATPDEADEVDEAGGAIPLLSRLRRKAQAARGAVAADQAGADATPAEAPRKDSLLSRRDYLLLILGGSLVAGGALLVGGLSWLRERLRTVAPGTTPPEPR